MIMPYVGAAKAYCIFPIFSVFGVNIGAMRLFGAVLASVSILGVGTFLKHQVSPVGAFFGMLFLAIHPAVIDQSVYDNNAVALWLFAFGALLIGMDRVIRARSLGWLYLTGVAAGFGIWGRLNFAWLLAAMATALLLVLRKRAIPSAKEATAVAFGVITGSAPLLIYVLQSGNAIAAVLTEKSEGATWLQFLAYRIPLLLETLLSDSEHRFIWGITSLPVWQIAFTAALALTSLVMCLLPAQRGADHAWPRMWALVLLLFVGIMMFSRLPIAEHHFVAVIPILAISVGAAAQSTWKTGRIGRLVVISASLIYAGCAMDWNIRAASGVRATRGNGYWSDAVNRVNHDLLENHSNKLVHVLEWGTAKNLAVLSGERLNLVEVSWSADRTTTSDGRSLLQLVSGGSLFLLRSASPFSSAFAQALADSGRSFR